ncbi:MAG TPA: APC family permease [Gemmatimonadaceae bacterium]|nr:APC family permease [Gemmatimonadaceae bacterium]
MTSPQGVAPAALERVMGVRALAASAVNMTVGSGIFVLPATVAAAIGTGAPMAYLVCALAMALVVLCFAEAGSRVSRSGGGYAYATAAFGPYVGMLAGTLLYTGAGVLASASVMNVFVGTLAVIAPAFGAGVPRVAVMALVYGGLAWVNVRGARPGVRTMEVFSFTKLVPLAALAALGLFALRSTHVPLPTLPPMGALGRASVTLIFAFLGFENSLNPSGEVKDPHRTVPRGVLLALVVVTVLYLTLQFVAQAVLGARLATETAAPLAAAAETLVGPVGATVILVGALISTFGYLTGDVLTSPRALLAMAEDGRLPSVLARVHPRYRTPWVAILTHAVLALTLAATGSFATLIVIANVAVLLLYGTVSLGVFRLRARGVRTEGAPFVVPGGPLVPAGAAVVIAGLLSTVSEREWLWTGGTLIVASALYAASRALARPAATAG